ncbi:MAG: bacteriohemerythrin [Treponema sp.]|nr:bacteriohemerythrin [Treponema sp.]
MLTKRNELITWTNTFACGIKLIDDQHKELVNLVNGMFNHITGDPEEEREYFNKIIGEAVKYVKVHFATEERIMRHTRFAGYAEHKREHDNFVLTVVENVRIFNAGGQLTLTIFTKFLKNWVLSHIAVADKQYFTYLRRIASRKANGKLSITSEDIR